MEERDIRGIDGIGDRWSERGRPILRTQVFEDCAGLHHLHPVVANTGYRAGRTGRKELRVLEPLREIHRSNFILKAHFFEHPYHPKSACWWRAIDYNHFNPPPVAPRALARDWVVVNAHMIPSANLPAYNTNN